MGDEILAKIRTVIDSSYMVNESKVDWSDEDDMGIDVMIKTIIINDSANAKEYIALVRKIRSSLMKGYNVHITTKFTL